MKAGPVWLNVHFGHFSSEATVMTGVGWAYRQAAAVAFPTGRRGLNSIENVEASHHC
jgi:hypothetical protein